MFLFNLSGHRNGIVARVRSPPHPEEVDAAGTKTTQSHLLHVEQAEHRLYKTEEEERGTDPELWGNRVELCGRRLHRYAEQQGYQVGGHSTPVLQVMEYGEAVVRRAD